MSQQVKVLDIWDESENMQGSPCSQEAATTPPSKVALGSYSVGIFIVLLQNRVCRKAEIHHVEAMKMKNNQGNL